MNTIELLKKITTNKMKIAISLLIIIFICTPLHSLSQDVDIAIKNKKGELVPAIVVIEDNDESTQLFEQSTTGKFSFKLPNSVENFGIFVKANGYYTKYSYYTKNQLTTQKQVAIVLAELPASIETGLQTISKRKEAKEKNIAQFPEFLEANSVQYSMYFPSGKFTVDSESLDILNKIIELMDNYQGVKCEVIGYASSEGSEQKNLSLSKKRSKEVVDFLVKEGIQRHRFRYFGVGEVGAMPAKEREIVRKKDRKVEIIFFK